MGRAVTLRLVVVAFLDAAFTVVARFAPVERFFVDVPEAAFSCLALFSQYSERVSRAALGAALGLRELAALREAVALLAGFLVVLVAIEVKGEVNQLQIRSENRGLVAIEGIGLEGAETIAGGRRVLIRRFRFLLPVLSSTVGIPQEALGRS